MADVTTSGDNVSVRSGTVTKLVQCGEAVGAAKMLYQKASDGKYYLADANVDAEVAGSEDIVFTIHATQAADEYVSVATGGKVDPGESGTAGIVAAGVTYYLSATGGGVWGDTIPASGSYSTRLGVGSAAGEIELDIKASGYQVA